MPTFLKRTSTVLFAFAGIFCIGSLICSGLAFPTTLILIAAKAFDKFDHPWWMCFIPILAISAAWAITGITAILGLTLRVASGK